MDAVAGTQPGGRAVDVRPLLGIVAFGIGEGAIYVDETHARGAGLCADDVGDELQRLVAALVAHRRQADPVEGDIATADHLHDLTDAAGVFGFPGVGAEEQRASGDADVAGVVGAQHDDGDVQRPVLQNAGDGARPVVKARTHQAGTLPQASPGDETVISFQHPPQTGQKPRRHLVSEYEDAVALLILWQGAAGLRLLHEQSGAEQQRQRHEGERTAPAEGHGVLRLA